MNNKVNYALVGFFVLLSFVLMFGFTYWMLKPSQEHETQKYLIYFDESVLGLNIDAPVKYRGISVGKVSRLRISPTNSEQVEVLVTILKTTPIKANTIAKLTAQGITGLTYINLSLGSNDAPALEVKEGYEYPVIKTAPSFFENFEKSLGSVSSQLSSTLGRTEELLNDENQKQLSLLLNKTASVMNKIDKALDEKTIENIQKSVQHMESFSEKLDAIMPNVDKFINKSIVWEDDISNSLGSIMQSYLGIKASMKEIKRAVESGEFNLKDITADIIPTMNNTLLEMQGLMIKFEDVLERYERSPSDILYKTEEIKKAPGEK